MQLIILRCGQGNASARDRQGPCKGLLSEAPLSCLCWVAALPCYQHRSWEPVRRPAGSVSSGVVGMPPSSLLPVLLICQTPVPQGCGLHVDRKSAHTHIHTCRFQGHVRKRNPGLNFADEVWSTKPRNLILGENCTLTVVLPMRTIPMVPRALVSAQLTICLLNVLPATSHWSSAFSGLLSNQWFSPSYHSPTKCSALDTDAIMLCTHVTWFRTFSGNNFMMKMKKTSDLSM